MGRSISNIDLILDQVFAMSSKSVLTPSPDKEKDYDRIHGQ